MDEETSSRLKALYEETVVPLNDEFEWERAKISAQVWKIVIGGTAACVLLYFGLKYFDSGKVLSHTDIFYIL